MHRRVKDINDDADESERTDSDDPIPFLSTIPASGSLIPAQRAEDEKRLELEVCVFGANWLASYSWREIFPRLLDDIQTVSSSSCSSIKANPASPAPSASFTSLRSSLLSTMIVQSG